MKKKLKEINAVTGYPLTHSKSPLLHNFLYRYLKIPANFVKLESQNIKKVILKIKKNNYKLIAVTMPHKQSVINFLDVLDKQAKEIYSVNTILNNQGKLHGFNTDIDGIKFALRKTKIQHQNVLIIGAGGAAKAVAFVVKKEKGKIFWLNRSKTNAKKMQKKFGGTLISYPDLNSLKINLVINTTPIGMYPKTNFSPLREYRFKKFQTIFDVIYNPGVTKLLSEAKKAGAKTISGIDMFIGQALRQDELWLNKKIYSQKLINQLKKILIEQ